MAKSNAQSLDEQVSVNAETQRLLGRLRQIQESQTVSTEVAVLAESILHLLKLVASLRSTGLEAFEQIQELDRRQGPGDD